MKLLFFLTFAFRSRRARVISAWIASMAFGAARSTDPPMCPMRSGYAPQMGQRPRLKWTNVVDVGRQKHKELNALNIIIIINIINIIIINILPVIIIN